MVMRQPSGYRDPYVWSGQAIRASLLANPSPTLYYAQAGRLLLSQNEPVQQASGSPSESRLPSRSFLTCIGIPQQHGHKPAARDVVICVLKTKLRHRWSLVRLKDPISFGPSL
jgi:hypothetical protein